MRRATPQRRFGPPVRWGRKAAARSAADSPAPRGVARTVRGTRQARRWRRRRSEAAPPAARSRATQQWAPAAPLGAPLGHRARRSASATRPRRARRSTGCPPSARPNVRQLDHDVSAVIRSALDLHPVARRPRTVLRLEPGSRSTRGGKSQPAAAACGRFSLQHDAAVPRSNGCSGLELQRCAWARRCSQTEKRSESTDGGFRHGARRVRLPRAVLSLTQSHKKAQRTG